LQGDQLFEYVRHWSIARKYTHEPKKKLEPIMDKAQAVPIEDVEAHVLLQEDQMH
jgi:hypothetical protein